MRIQINNTSHQLLKDLLSQHRDGKSRLLWNKSDYQLPPQYRKEAAVPLLNQLDGNPKSLCVYGHQRDLLLQLLAWESLSERSAWNEIGPIKELLSKLQPQGTPLEAEISDYVVLKQSGVLVEIVHFGGGFHSSVDDGYFVTGDSTGFIVCEAYANLDDEDLRFIDCSLDDLMWPELMSAEAIIWGPCSHRLAA